MATNVTPRRSKRLQDADSEEAEVVWDFGSASPRSRLDLCRKYDKMYHSANEELRGQLATWFPETAGESTEDSPLTQPYESRLQPVARDASSSSRRKRADERQRRKDKALQELQAVVKEINQNDARASASPVLDITPKSRRSERRITGDSPAVAAAHEPVPCQLFSGPLADDENLNDLFGNVDEIFALSQEELEQVLGASPSSSTSSSPSKSRSQPAAPVSSRTNDTSSAHSSANQGSQPKQLRSATAVDASSREQSKTHTAHSTNSTCLPSDSRGAAGAGALPAAFVQQRQQQRHRLHSSQPRSDEPSPAVQQGVCTHRRHPTPGSLSRSASAQTAGKHSSKPGRPTGSPENKPPGLKSAGGSTGVGASTVQRRSSIPQQAHQHQQQRKPLSSTSSQQRRCTQGEIERKRRLARQRLAKRNFSAQHATASQTNVAGGTT
eukprot:scpid72595/ scgid34761/ 